MTLATLTFLQLTLKADELYSEITESMQAGETGELLRDLHELTAEIHRRLIPGATTTQLVQWQRMADEDIHDARKGTAPPLHQDAIVAIWYRLRREIHAELLRRQDAHAERTQP